VQPVFKAVFFRQTLAVFQRLCAWTALFPPLLPLLLSAAATLAPADDLQRELLAVSLTGIIFDTPLYDPAGSGKFIDFIFRVVAAV